MVITENKPVRTGSSSSSFIMAPVQSQNRLYTGGSQVATPTSSIEIITFLEKTPIPASNYVLQRSLLAEMQITKDGITIRSDYIDEESYGSIFSVAYIDFLTSIRDRYQSLRSRKKHLSPHDQSVLGRLHILLEPS